MAQKVITTMKLKNKNLSNFIITIMKFKFSLVISLFSIVLFSCTDIDIDATTETEALEIMSQAMQTPESDEAIDIVNTVIDDYLVAELVKSFEGSKVGSALAIPKVELISEKGVYPENYVIDFGNGDYINANGKTIQGKVYYSKNDKLGTIRTYRFVEFFINAINIKSYRTINKKSTGIIAINATDTIVYKNGDSVNREWNRTRTLIDNNPKPEEYWNNSYEYQGSSKGTTVSKKDYSMSIEKTLVSMDGYKYYVSGVVKINTDKGEQYIDFGKGEKDNIATITTNGKEKEVKLNWE